MIGYLIKNVLLNKNLFQRGCNAGESQFAPAYGIAIVRKCYFCDFNKKNRN